MKYNAYEVFELLLFVFDMGYNKKKYSFFSSNYEQRGNKYVPKHNHTFYWHLPSMMQLRVSHYYGDVILHFTESRGMNKQDRYLPMRESEFVALLSMGDEINKQIKKIKKIARKERQHSDNESDNNFTQVPYHPCRNKGQTNILHPAVILMILQVVVKKLLKVQAWEKEGAKSLNLQRKRKQKKWRKKMI